MKRAITLALMALSCGCAASGNIAATQFPMYSLYVGGEYATKPVSFPSELPEQVILAVLSAAENVTEERIGRVGFETDESGESIPNRLIVYTCSSEESCNGGQYYRFENRAGGWAFIDERPGFWVT